jgi:1-deoxy-D-xylulose-5-phosphate synthase
MDLLDRIEHPEGLRNFSLEELEGLAGELRKIIIDTINRNGGHLASPLGVVELTIALHRVFDFSVDRLIWDVGHQCYAHKLLTGRKDRFASLRIRDGISGYPKRSESAWDHFGTGHSSTSISAALGMAIARDRRQEGHHVVAVIGDGAMTGGMALEGLLHAGHVGTGMLVILNDNEMSISRNVGTLARMFNRLIMAGPYKRAKEEAGSYVKKLIGDQMTRTIQDLEKSVKGFITKGALFQELGFNYIGPVDGHDLPLLIECLENVKQMKEPVFLHCRTEKGKGLKAAEEDPAQYHGVKPRCLDKPGCLARRDEEGDAFPAHEKGGISPVRTFTDVFSETICQFARRDERITAITAAMPAGTGLSAFEKFFPDRYFDVGICEQHAVTLAGGQAAEGLRPVVAIYSTFLQRGFDQVVHDIALQKLPVIFAIDRAGLVGADSPTHAGSFDISFLRAIPGMTILAPRDSRDLDAMFGWALEQEGPVAIRYPRAIAPVFGAAESRNIPHGEMLREGADAAFLALGPCAEYAIEAAVRLAKEELSVAVADPRSVAPLDTDLLDRLAHLPLITVEDNVLSGGFGSAVLEYFADSGRLQDIRIKRLGIPDSWPEQATRDEQLSVLGLDTEGLAEAMRRFVPVINSHVLQ